MHRHRTHTDTNADTTSDAYPDHTSYAHAQRTAHSSHAHTQHMRLTHPSHTFRVWNEVHSKAGPCPPHKTWAIGPHRQHHTRTPVATQAYARAPNRSDSHWTTHKGVSSIRSATVCTHHARLTPPRADALARLAPPCAKQPLGTLA